MSSAEVSNMAQYPPLPRFTTASSYKTVQPSTTAETEGTTIPTNNADTIVTEVTNHVSSYVNNNDTNPTTGGGVPTGTCDQDFDLLAEYLLDDNTLNSSVVGFANSGYYDVR